MTLDPKLRMAFEPLRSIAFGSINSNYATLGNALSNPVRVVSLYNGCNADMLISIDGTTDHLIMPTTSTLILDIATNKEGTGKLYLPIGTQFYIKDTGAAATSGNFYLAVIYGR